jgi:hypothetical protein
MTHHVALEGLWNKISAGYGAECHLKGDNVSLRQKIAY